MLSETNLFEKRTEATQLYEVYKILSHLKSLAAKRREMVTIRAY